MGRSKRKKTNTQVFECIKCSKTGTKQVMMEHFVRAHVTKQRVPWSCSKCGFRAPSKQALHRHEGHFVHKSAEKAQPGVPTTYIKSCNPYTVRIGQDIVPVNETTAKGINNGGQEEWKSRFGEGGPVTSKRRWSDMNDSDKEANLQDYDVRGSPAMPDYGSCDERRDVQSFGHKKRPRRQDPPDRSRSSNLDQFLSQQAEVHIPHTDTTHKEFIPPDRYDRVTPKLMTDQKSSVLHTVYPSLKLGIVAERFVDPVLKTEISSRQMCYPEVPYIGHSVCSTSGNQSELPISNAKAKNLSGQDELMQTSNNRRDEVGRKIKVENWDVHATETDRIATSSSTTKKGSLESECKARGLVCTPPHSVGTLASGELPAASLQNGAGSPCRNLDQSAEVGSSCFGGRDKSIPTTSCDMGEEPVEFISSADFNTHVREESEEDQDEDDPKCQDDDVSDSHMLEEKVSDLVAALEPLKNISKALIALDHHMRRLLPLVEDLTKGNFKKQE